MGMYQPISLSATVSPSARSHCHSSNVAPAHDRAITLTSIGTQIPAGIGSDKLQWRDV